MQVSSKMVILKFQGHYYAPLLLKLMGLLEQLFNELRPLVEEKMHIPIFQLILSRKL